MQTGVCELYRPPDGIGTKPSCDALRILTELYNLLDEYGPVWYRPEHHEALKSTLEKMNRMGGILTK